MTRILASDILIADVITPMAGNEKLQALVKKYQLLPGGKRAIDREQFDEFSAAVSGHPVTIAPGGSSANVLTTLAAMLGDEVAIDFIGAIGDGLSSTMIRESLEEARINLLPKALPGTVVAKTAVSYVVMLPGGQRTIATYPGNARAVLTPEMIGEELVRGCDALLIQGSLWNKMGDAYADRLYRLGTAHKKEIWLALPTYSMPSGNHVDKFQEVMARAELVLGNEEELARIYGTTAEAALKSLQKAFGRDAKRVGFITRGDQGAALVTCDDVVSIAPPKRAGGAIVNTLGAGDTAFAGFLAGHLRKKPHRQCADIAMALAAEKLSVNAARLPDAKAVLQRILNWLDV